MIRDRWHALDALMECEGWPLAPSDWPCHLCCEERAVRPREITAIAEHSREILAAGSDTEVVGSARYYVLTLLCPLCEETYKIELRPKEDQDGAEWWEWERLHGVTA